MVSIYFLPLLLLLLLLEVMGSWISIGVSGRTIGLSCQRLVFTSLTKRRPVFG